MENLVVTGVDEEVLAGLSQPAAEHGEFVVDASVALTWVVREADNPEADTMLGLRLLVPKRANARVVTADRLLNKLAASPTFAHLAISLQDTAAN